MVSPQERDEGIRMKAWGWENDTFQRDPRAMGMVKAEPLSEKVEQSWAIINIVGYVFRAPSPPLAQGAGTCGHHRIPQSVYAAMVWPSSGWDYTEFGAPQQGCRRTLIFWAGGRIITRVVRGKEVLMTELHGVLAFAVALYSLVSALWGLALGLRRRPTSPSYRGALVINEMLVIAQGLLGTLLLVSGRRPADPLHILYGFLSVITLPVAYAYVGSRRDERHDALIFGLGAVILFLLVLRGIVTSA